MDPATLVQVLQALQQLGQNVEDARHGQAQPPGAEVAPAWQQHSAGIKLPLSRLLCMPDHSAAGSES